ncbi:MAG: prenyltransferase/squalene oxidase repeat-containing protein [Bryobacteraceae bacterium]|jgi:hypothetical protein
MVSLLVSQNLDGGWPYQRGGPSWTEPTAYALLALIAQGSVVEPVARGLAWLHTAQRSDGGWPPQPSVRQSAWVTAVATMLGPAKLGKDAHRRGVAWIVRQTGEETSFLSRVQQFLTGNAEGYHGCDGWPWFPESSAWVTPSALSMLALRKVAPCADSAQIPARLDKGASYLLQHVCSDGGWNHGGARAMGYDARSYPETTGVALLALRGRDSPAIRRACGWAQARLPACRTSEGESWLRLGLLAHGQLPSNVPPARPPRTVQDAALALLAWAAVEGRNLFLEQQECPV